MNLSTIALLIRHYEDVIEQVKNVPKSNELLTDNDAVYKVLVSNNTDRGICHCASKRFGIDIYSDPWIKSRGDGVYFCTPPSLLIERDDVIQALQKRVDIMKTFEEKDKKDKKDEEEPK